MKKLELISLSSLNAGDLYLFHQIYPTCPQESSLWGFYDKTEDDTICLEHCTTDLSTFQSWYRLPSEYLYCRLATRNELRDYMYNMGFSDAESK